MTDNVCDLWNNLSPNIYNYFQIWDMFFLPIDYAGSNTAN